ncbi:MAG: hypothetical protein K1X67_07425 [Fimbriimonadaceae bacterium]|nr:hypothetical protein [Fimbriimonadaceae bacterium]
MNQAGVGSMIPVSAPRQVRLIPDLRSYRTARAIRTNQTGVTSTSESSQAGQQERPPQRNDYGGKYDIIC